MAALNISVVIPTYNRAQLVGRAVESVLNQTKPPAEIIVVDDGSQDDTQVQLARFGTQIRYIHQANQGAAVARDTGARIAESDWIAFLDSDDYWERPYLQQMNQAMVATSEHAHLYFADAYVPPSYKTRTFWEYRNFAIEGEFSFCQDGTEWAMMPGQPMSVIVSIIRRQAYFACGGFWAEMHNREDTHLFLKLGLGQPICAVACLGATISEDDLPENRQTGKLTLDPIEGHFYQVKMLSDILSGDLPSTTRRKLQKRLAKGHYSLARLYGRKGAWKTAVSHLWRSWQIDPKVSQRQILQKLSRSGSPTLQREYN
ncbi:MAG: glycosyltransferase family 2 protein [Chloroflexi bacterium]|nr:glycosyltransferase family 2 protein [Chloroflexota bacterium]